jgi:hypothetical protein
MAAVTVQAKGDAQFVSPAKTMWMCDGTGAKSSNAQVSIENLRTLVITVAVGADGDTFTLGTPGVKCVWWKGVDGSANNIANPYISDVATGEITVVTNTATPSGYLFIEVAA